MHPESGGQLSCASNYGKRPARPFLKTAAVLLPFVCLCLLGLPATARSELEEVSSLEMHFFAHDYAGQALSQRIERLEKFVFGEAESGALKARVSQLVSAAPSTESAPEQTASNRVERTAVSPPEKAMSPPAEASDYPTVTRIEKLILGTTYRNDTLPARLARLEATAFGKSSSLNDLAGRVDRLKAYAGLSLPESLEDFAGLSEPAWQEAASPDLQSGLVASISELEEAVFARTYGAKPLLARVRALELAMDPSAPAPELSLLERIGKLRAAIRQERTLAGVEPQPAGPVVAVPPPSYLKSAPGRSMPPAYSAAAGPSPTCAPSRKHPFMHALAKALEVAGQLAAGALGGGYYASGVGVPSGGLVLPGFGPSPFGGAPIFINGRWY